MASRFIEGEPMNAATKTLSGRRRGSGGVDLLEISVFEYGDSIAHRHRLT